MLRVRFGMACYLKMKAGLPLTPQTPPPGVPLIACLQPSYYPPSPSPSPPGPHTNTGGGDTGTSILLVFACGIVLPYFTIGVLFRKYRRNAEGNRTERFHCTARLPLILILILIFAQSCQSKPPVSLSVCLSVSLSPSVLSGSHVSAMMC